MLCTITHQEDGSAFSEALFHTDSLTSQLQSLPQEARSQVSDLVE